MNSASSTRPTDEVAEDATLQEILSVAAHELRQPATVIYGLATTLLAQRSRLEPHELDESVQRIEHQATRLVRLLDDLLDVSRLQTGRLEVELRSVDLAEAVEGALSAAAPPPGKQVEVLVPAVSVIADPAGLERVFVNLLTNAYRYGGPKVVIEARGGTGHVRVVVADDGGGVPMNLVPHLFRPFLAGAGGTGLGLAIVLGLVEAFGGSISYQPSEPVGARFELTLRSGPATPRVAPQKRYAFEARGAVTILIVDDEPDILFLLRLTLEAAGYSVAEAAHGAEALEVIHSERPSLLITDLMMPVMDGRELIRRVREAPETSDLPIMVLSANPDQRVGADRVMRKPFNTRDLTRAVDELVGSGE